MTNTASTGDERQQPSFVINDFSPGCYSNSLTSDSNPTPSPQSAPGPFPAPLGAADANFTHGCMNLPTGGLGPLPQMVQSYSLQSFGMFVPSGGPIVNPYIIGFYCTGMGGQGGNDELVSVQTYAAGAPTFVQVYAQSFKWNSPGSNNLFYSESYGLGTPPYPVPSCVYPYMTRVANTGPTVNPGTPVLVLPLANNDKTTNVGMVLYPDPSNVSGYGTHTIGTMSNQVGQGFGHQGRIVQLGPVAGNASQNVNWPGQPPGVYYGEAISYTDPANSTTWGNQMTVFGPENPFGYGGVTSVSAGELFMIKSHGGGIIVQGDINNPTVTNLPGVKSTGPIYGQTGQDPAGAYYCTDDHGAWVWNGGNASTKISAQLDDNFYTPPNMPPVNYNGIQNYGYFCQRWGNWMLFSNNWIYNTGGGGGWWRLYDPAVASFFFYTQGADDDIMYACVPYTPTSITQCYFRFDATNPTNYYQWRSLPIRPQAGDRTIAVREVTVRASNPFLDPGATVTVSVTSSQGVLTNLGTWDLTNTSTGVQIHTFNAGVIQTDDVVVSLACGGANVAPTIWDLTVGYRVRERAALQ